MKQKFLILILLMFSFSANALVWGVGTDWKTLTQALPILKQRNIKSIRVNAAYDIDHAKFRAAMTAAKAQGIRVTAIFFTSFQWDPVCNQNLTTVEAKAYAQTYAVINDLKDVVYDWEMQNEVDLSDNCPMHPAGLGRAASDYESANSHLKAANLHGISRAINDIRIQSKLPLRRILNFTQFHTGFVDFMLANGVQFEVISYHYYELQGKTPYNGGFYPDKPMSSGWNIFAALARYNRPIHINEYNAAEIYQAGYYNVSGDPLTEKGYKAIHEQMEFWRTAEATVKSKYGATIKLENVSAYCLTDNPAKGNPYSGLAADAESRFGLMYDWTHPKIALLLLTAYAGGTLSTSENAALISHGLLTQQQIDSFKPKPSVTFPNGVTLKNNVPMSLAPVVVNAPANLNCQGVLLPDGLAINAQTCVISGAPRVAGTIPAGGYVRTTTIIIGALSTVSIFNFTIVP